METIFKVCLLGNENSIQDILVFNGNAKSKEPVFNSKEQEFIDSENIRVHYSNHFLHIDDSVSTIKNKILKQLDFRISYHELYLFSNIIKTIDLQELFDNIRGKNDYISKNELQQLLLNLGIPKSFYAKIDSSKKHFLLDDIIEIQNQMESNEVAYKTSIGKKFRNQHNEMFSANPFDVVFLKNSSTNPLESFENQLLLNTGIQYEQNTIYCCFAEDVLEYAETAGLSLENMMAVYYPLLAKEDVFSIGNLEKKKDVLLKKTRQMASSYMFSLYDRVDYFYDIYKGRKSDMQYDSKGVSVFSIILRPTTTFLLPLDVVFKNIHSTQTVPFIKYNPGFRRENIYRFYSEKITKFGTKIPFLPGKTILKLAKETGKKKEISFSVEHESGDFYVDLQTNGDVRISGNNFKRVVSLEVLNKLIQEVVNPILEHMNELLKKSGYELNYFESIRNRHIDVEYLQFNISMRIIKEMDIQKYQKCLAPIFNIQEDSDIYKGLTMRYKRVENYNQMDEETIYILALYNQNKSHNEITQMVSDKYEISFEKASKKYADFIRDNETMLAQGRYIDSPGFAVSMSVKSYEDIFVCSVDFNNITSPFYMEYLDCFEIYMDSLLRIIQEPKMTSVSSNVSKICKDGKVEDEVRFENMIVGVDVVYDDKIMYMDEEQLDMSKDPADYEDEGDAEELKETAFGDLKQYESVNISEDIEPIEDYENETQLSELSEIKSEETKREGSQHESSKEESSKESSKEGSKEGSNDLMFAPDEGSQDEGSQEKSSKEEGSQEKSSKESSNDLMFAPEEESSKESSKGSNDLMFAPEESSQEESSKEKTGGNKNIDGMLLKENNNNIFLNQLKKREPTLFLSEDQGHYNAYSKLCQSSRLRQPVILTQEEKDKIDANDKESNSKSYNHALEYGTDPENKHWYICPRYWCLKTNSSISEEDVKAGKCGKIIPKGAKQVPKGHYVYEFNHPIQHHNKDGSYKENTPGFLEGSLHPKGLCLPCCFKKEWGAKSQLERRQECMGEIPQKKEKKLKNVKQEEYIYEIRRFPIPPKRYGFLPYSVQLFLQIDNSEALDKDNNKYLNQEESTRTLLRYGVEKSTNKSFIACVADLYAYKKQLEKPPSIQEMSNIIAEAITLDLFVQYHNSSLVSIFKPKVYDLDEIDPTKYEDTDFFKQLDLANEKHVELLNTAIAAYENFKEFITHPDSIVDHTYLWDIICSPNIKLFQTGCNLAIIRMRDVDVTDDIEILCPTSVYSSVLYDMRKETFILIKFDDMFYEPIYLFKQNVKKEAQKIISRELVIQKTFLEENIMPNIRTSLQIIRNSIKKYCAPQSSAPRVYKFKKGILAEQLKMILLKYKFTILKQVLNYNGKTIGLWVRAKDDGVMIPCYPSAQLSDFKIIMMDEMEIWNDYETTRDRLKKIFSITNGEIPCRPKFKVKEDGLIVGLITETNQFLMVDPPAEDIYTDGIPVMDDENHIVTDKTITQSSQEDEERIRSAKMISLETQFYSAFRTIIRDLLHRSNNKHYREKIVETIENPRYSYKSKLEFVEKIVKTIAKNQVSFQEFEEAVLMELEEISDCFTNPAQKNYCVLKTNGEYQMILPIRHLISGMDNYTVYYSRVSDELVRYKRIQMFMMDKKIYLNITNNEYKIKENEMIMLESLLTADYFKSIEPYAYGKTATITYETANPIKTQTYSNDVTLAIQAEMAAGDVAKEVIQDNMGIECIRRVIPIIGKTGTFWRTFFGKSATETELYQSVKCSFFPILFIHNSVYKIQMTIEQVKAILIQEYMLLMSTYGNKKILGILRKQGKLDMINDVLNDKYTFETAISSEVYYLTNLDYWVLANKLKLPIVLFHQKSLRNLIDGVNWLRLYSDAGNESRGYYFIRVATEPVRVGNYLPQYNIVKPVSQNIMELMSNADEFSLISLFDYLQKVELKI